jgi:hypothetical protein
MPTCIDATPDTKSFRWRLTMAMAMGADIEELLTLWLSWSAEEIENQLWWLPS